MTEREAYGVLGVPAGSELDEIKRRYRQLMLRVHPDVDGRLADAGLEDAQKINQAYALLKKRKAGSLDGVAQEKKKAGKDVRGTWDAPVNEGAFCEREVFCHAEDFDGTVIGRFCIAEGKYFWTTEEDFPLFLLSLYRCGKRLLEEIDSGLQRPVNAERQQRVQTELTYLLAQQFTDAESLLKELAKEEKDAKGRSVFYLTAMLELNGRIGEVPEGERLFPKAIRKHRLYLADQEGQELGYLSFPDDRLYYLIVPLFELRRVQVRIRVKEKKADRKRRGSGRYQNLHLWLRLSGGNEKNLLENLNLRIRRLLEEYSGS